MFTSAKQAQGESVPVGHPQQRQDFVYRREAGIWVYLIQSLFVMAFIFFGWLVGGWKFSKSITPDWGAIFSNALWISWLGGAVYFGFSLWRWSKLAWFENVFGVNLDKDPRKGNGKYNRKHPTMHIKVTFPDGSARNADVGIDVKDKRFILEIARAMLAGRPNSQMAMKRSVRMPRPKHEKIMRAFEKLGVLEKEIQGVSNSKYVISDPVDVNKEILKEIAYGRYEMLEDVWAAE